MGRDSRQMTRMDRSLPFNSKAMRTVEEEERVRERVDAHLSADPVNALIVLSIG